MQKQAEGGIDVGFEGVGSFLEAQNLQAAGGGQDVETEEKGGDERCEREEVKGEEESWRRECLNIMEVER